MSFPPSGLVSPFRWLAHRPYLLLSLTSLFWAGNIVLGRYVAGHVPPVALSFFRWAGAFFILLAIAWPHLRADWPAIRANLRILIILSLTGIAAYNTLGYYGLQYTEALNASLMQSAFPLFVAFWSLILFRQPLTPAQVAGIAISLAGVLVIILRGDIETLTHIRVNQGDILFAAALFIFAFYSALAVRRPNIHPLSFLTFITGLGALEIAPVLMWEISNGHVLKADFVTGFALAYVATMPSVAAYLCFNRGIELIGPNRAAPFFHLMPVFASALAIVLLGETPRFYHAIGYALVIAGIFIAARK
jgi:drug/metabolite transporter (DMT)-like permease